MGRVREQLHMPDVTVCYGMTEFPPLLQSNPWDPVDRRVGGAVLPHIECKIVSPSTGDTVAKGAEGEIRARGYGLMTGYWGNPEATGSMVDTEGWLHTGDLGRMDHDGHVVITGRLKELIIRGGFNLHPVEIETSLRRHPGVQEGYVVGVPALRRGDLRVDSASQGLSTHRRRR